MLASTFGFYLLLPCGRKIFLERQNAALKNANNNLRKLHFAELKKANEKFFIEFIELKNASEQALSKLNRNSKIFKMNNISRIFEWELLISFLIFHLIIHT